jgi:hypothetical protein
MRLRLSMLLLLLAALPAAATTLMRMDVAALSQASDVVVRGSVVRKSSRWTGSGTRIITEVDVAVAETLRGTAPEKTVRVVQPGGEVGDVGQRVEGLASFQQGEEVVVFLERHWAAAFRVTGLAQGKYRVERSADGHTALAVPDSVGDAVLLDPATGEPVTQQQADSARRSLPLEELRRQVRAAPASQGAPDAQQQGKPQ